MKKIILFLYLFTSYWLLAQNYYSKLNKFNEFQAMQGEPLNEKVANMQSVKVVYDVFSQKIYFFNSKKFTYHYNFCQEILNYNKDIAQFNNDCYNANAKRIYLLANLNYLAQNNDWFLELAASDDMRAANIELLYNAVKKNVYFRDKLVFYLNTPRLMKLNENKAFSIPVVYSDFIFNQSTEQSIESGTTVGKLVQYDVLNNTTFQPKPDEIIIINTTPEIIPEVKGIIATEFQTPLSHLVLLAKNRNIPVYVDKNAWNNPKFKQLLGDTVAFTVTTSSYSLKKTSKKITKKIAPKPIQLKQDFKIKRIIPLNESIPLGGENYIGAKAQNLAILHQISLKNKEFKTPEYAYAIPFYYYNQHIQQNGIQHIIDELLIIPKDSIENQNRLLKDIRKKIKNAPVDTALIRQIENIIKNQQQFKSFKFRSSTNAEDIEGFNGAGLYDSKSAQLGDSVKTIARAIQTVWSSLWNERAYRERELFHIDHNSCAMGILFHRSFPDEIANGVVISENLYRKKYKGITANIQTGEISVVNPDKTVNCDEFYAHNFNFLSEKISIDYRSISNLNNHIPILSQEEINKLFMVTLNIEKKINAIWKKNKTVMIYRPIDIEVKWEGETKQFYIKQIRAYMD